MPQRCAAAVRRSVADYAIRTSSSSGASEIAPRCQNREPVCTVARGCAVRARTGAGQRGQARLWNAAPQLSTTTTQSGADLQGFHPPGCPTRLADPSPASRASLLSKPGQHSAPIHEGFAIPNVQFRCLYSDVCGCCSRLNAFGNHWSACATSRMFAPRAPCHSNAPWHEVGPASPAISRNVRSRTGVPPTARPARCGRTAESRRCALRPDAQQVVRGGQPELLRSSAAQRSGHGAVCIRGARCGLCERGDKGGIATQRPSSAHCMLSHKWACLHSHLSQRNMPCHLGRRARPMLQMTLNAHTPL